MTDRCAFATIRQTSESNRARAAAHIRHEFLNRMKSFAFGSDVLALKAGQRTPWMYCLVMLFCRNRHRM